jgi:hypothetical protein
MADVIAAVQFNAQKANLTPELDVGPATDKVNF